MKVKSAVEILTLLIIQKKSTNGPRAKATFLLCQQTAFSLLRLASITAIYEKPSDGSDQSGVSFEPQVHGKSQQSI